MKSIQFLKKTVGVSLFIASFLVSGCLEKDLYQPEDNQPPSENDYFDFQLRGDIKLSVNYDAPGFKALIKVYSENPMDESGNLKDQLEPIYSAYTDNNGKLEASMYVPTMVKEAYLYTHLIGLPQCVKMELTSVGFVYDAAGDTKTKVGMTRAASDWMDLSSFPYKLKANVAGGGRKDNMYSLVQWDANGVPSGEQFTKISQIGGEDIGSISKRVTDFLIDNNVNTTIVGNKELLREPNQINIKTPSEGAEVSVTFVGAKGGYHNSFGYYYYPTNNNFGISQFYGAKKYVIFPHAHLNALKPGDTVKLLYFDEKGQAHEKFPAGYTVGWFLISDGFNSSLGSFVKLLEEVPFLSPALYTSGRISCMSNDTGNDRRFITVYDKKSQLYVIGIEDMTNRNAPDDYMDLTFFVKTTPDLGKGDLEEVPSETPEKPGEDGVNGTLAFEDNWPNSGDYDMNDVAVEYKRNIQFDGNNYATKVVETFKFVQREDAATFHNFFAYQVATKGTVTSKSDECIYEDATRSFVINKSARSSIGKTFTIERTFAANEVKKDDLKLKTEFNPFIIAKGYSTEEGSNSKDRVEVHLPKYQPTIYANKSLNNTGDDAYYVNKEGAYPYAIDIPVLNFELSPEKTPIGVTYPNFEKWALSKGKTNADWYNK